MYFFELIHIKFIFTFIVSLTTVRQHKQGVIAEAARILIQNLERRLPLTDEIIAAAILDPSIQHIEAIEEWLSAHNTTR